MRLDKFLWAIRLCKTRSIASTACNKDKVKLGIHFAKPSKTVAFGDIIAIKENPIWRSFKVLDIPKSRVGPKLVCEYLEEITSTQDLTLLEEQKLFKQLQKNDAWREGSKGRPTKKNRRDIERLKG